MKKSTIFGTLAVMAMAVTGAGYAQAYHGGDYHHRDYHHTEYRHGGCDNYRQHHNFHPGKGFRAWQEQNLTEEQRVKLGEMRKDHFKTMKPLFDDLRLKRMQLDVFRDNPNVKPDQLDKLIKDIIALENKVDTEKRSFRSQVEKEFGIDLRRPMPPMNQPMPVPAAEEPDEE